MTKSSRTPPSLAHRREAGVAALLTRTCLTSLACFCPPRQWVAGADHPSGQLLKSWQAPNVPTLVVRGGCGADASTGGLTSWRFEPRARANDGGGSGGGSGGGPPVGMLRSGEVCLVKE